MRRSSLSDAARRIKTFLSHDIWERDLADLGRMKALFFHQLRVVFLVMRGFAKDRCGLRAAGLTYITLLSFIPFLAVAFTLFDKVGGLDRLAEDHLKPFVYRVLTADPDVIPPASTVNGEETPGEDGLDLPDEGGEEAAPRDLAAEGRRAEIIRYIDQFVSNIETGGLGWAAGAFMLITAVGLLSSTEKSLNDIWGVKRQRSWFRRFTVYWAGITIGPVLLGISIALTAALQSNAAVKWVQDYVPFFKEALSILIPLLFAWGAFTLLYLYMPNTTVRLISALVGGVIAGTLWQTSIWGYSIYASSAIKWESIFGALGAIPLLLIWFYINWVIVLFGAEISFANQNAGTYRKEEASQSASPHFREIATLGIMTRIGRHHVQGMGPPSAVTLAQETRSPVRLVQDILYLLTKYGLVMEAAGTERSPGYVPARPLEQIGTQEVVNVVRHHAPMHLPLPAGEETAVVSNLVDQGDQAREEVFAPVSMAQLITEVGPSEEGEAPVESDSPMPMDGWPDDAEMADGLTHPADPTEIMPHEGEADPEEPGHPPSQDTDTTNT